VARLSSERKTFLALANLPDWLEKGIWKVDRMIRGSPRMLYAARSRGTSSVRQGDDVPEGRSRCRRGMTRSDRTLWPRDGSQVSADLKAVKGAQGTRCKLSAVLVEGPNKETRRRAKI
jgi:hypothetical protein